MPSNDHTKLVAVTHMATVQQPLFKQQIVKKLAAQQLNISFVTRQTHIP